MMPNMDGFEVCQRLRADSILAQVPIIMVTALDDRDSRLRGIEAGADDFISKPYDKQELQIRVKTITNLNRYRRLLTEQAKFKWMVENSNEAYLVLAKDNKILYMNTKACFYFNQTTNQPLNETFLELAAKHYHQVDKPSSIPLPINLTKLPPYLVRPETQMTQAFWLQVDVTEMKIESDEKYLVRLRDVTNTILVYQQQWTLKKQINYKLKMPLTAFGTTQYLLDNVAHLAKNEMREWLEVINENGKVFQSEIEDILKYMAISRKVQTTLDPCNLTDILSTITAVKKRLEIESIQISQTDQIENPDNLFVTLSDQAMEIILTALFSNAKKFHPKGTPIIDIGIVAMPDGIRLQVCDDGLTLSPEQLTNIWMPYYQGEKYFTGEKQGMGLGLAMVASLIWEVGGTCRAYNHSKGVAIELILPFVKYKIAPKTSQVCWTDEPPDLKQGTFEYQGEFKERLEKNGPYLAGTATLRKDKYKIDNSQFPIEIEWKEWVSPLNPVTQYLYINAERALAQTLFESSSTYPVFVQLTFDGKQVSMKTSILSAIDINFTISTNKSAWKNEQRNNWQFQLDLNPYKDTPSKVQLEQAQKMPAKFHRGIFELREEFKQRIEKIYVAGVATFLGKKYHIDDGIFPIEIRWENSLSLFNLTSDGWYIKAERDFVKVLYEESPIYPVFVHLAVGDEQIGVTAAYLYGHQEIIPLNFNPAPNWEEWQDTYLFEYALNIGGAGNVKLEKMWESNMLPQLPNLHRALFETQEEFQQRLENKAYLAVAATLKKDQYDIKNSIFRIDVRWESWLKPLNPITNGLYIEAKRDLAKTLYEKSPIHPIYIRLSVTKQQIRVLSLVLLGNDRIFAFKQEEDEKAWKKACQHDTPLSYQNYMAGKTLKRYANQVTKKEQADQDAWKEAQQQNTAKSYRAYLCCHTLKKYANEAIKCYEQTASQETQKRVIFVFFIIIVTFFMGGLGFGGLFWGILSATVVLVTGILTKKTFFKIALESTLQKIKKTIQAQSWYQQQIDEQAWQTACQQNTAQAYQAYLKENSLYAEEAKKRYEPLADEQAWQTACQQHTAQAYQAYLKGNTLKKYANLLDSNKQSENSQPFEFEFVTVNNSGKMTHRKHKQAYFQTEDLGKGVTLEMVEIMGGTFLMGSNQSDLEKPQHQVTVQSFYLSKYPITQAQWQVMMDYNPSWFKEDKHPVENVSWHDAIKFCQQLSKMTNKPYRLPSEAEWEYACRAGTTTPFHVGPTIITRLANFQGFRTSEVGIFPPNAFGLYDMHGNVWEWCADSWHNNYEGAPSDGYVWETKEKDAYRLQRGGSWCCTPERCRCASRSWLEGDKMNNDVGFRVALFGVVW